MDHSKIRQILRTVVDGVRFQFGPKGGWACLRDADSTVVERFPDLPSLPWDSFGPKLVDILEAVVNKVDREWPRKWQAYPGAAILLELFARSLQNTYHTIRTLCFDKPVWPIRREDVLSVGPLSRTILDTLFATVFLFHDLPTRWVWYYKAGWREIWEEHQRCTASYGADPAWQEWLTEQARFLASSATQYGVTPAEVANPHSILRWPIPSKMRRHKGTAVSRLQLMEYLNDWYYKALSSESHLSLPGLVMRSMALMPDGAPEEVAWHLDKQRSDNAAKATVLVLAFASEINIECEFDLAERLKYVWTVLSGYFGLAKELYEPWYSTRL